MERSRKIVVIDDEPGIRTLFRRQLKEEGYGVIEAEDGEKAVSLLRQNSDVGLVILDIAMPKSSGLDLFDIIRREFPYMKVLISSVYSKDEQGFLIEGADDYYYKSESIAVLIKKVNSLLKEEI